MRVVMACVLGAWIALVPLPACAADSVIVRDNLFSPTREPEAGTTHVTERSQAKKAEPLPDDAIVLKGVSIHGKRRWALLAVSERYLPTEAEQTPQHFFKRGRMTGGTMTRSTRRSGASSDHTVLVVSEGERLGEFRLETVGPDYAILSRSGRQFRIEMHNGVDVDMNHPK